MSEAFAIDAEFRDLIPALSPEEFDLLMRNVIGQGCLSPLIVARVDGELTLLDGHNRHDICTKYGVDFTTTELDGMTRDEAMDWIDKNQLGRRNLSPDQMSLIRGRIYNRTKRQDGGHGDQRSERQNGDPILPASQKMAEEHGVSKRTIERDGQFANAVDALKDVAPDLAKQLGTKDAPSKKDVIAAAKLSGNPEAAMQVLTNTVPEVEEAEDDEPAAQMEVSRGEREQAESIADFYKTLDRLSDGTIYTLDSMAAVMKVSRQLMSKFTDMCIMSPAVKVHYTTGRKGLVQYRFEKTNSVNGAQQVRKLAKAIIADTNSGRVAVANATRIIQLIGE